MIVMLITTVKVIDFMCDDEEARMWFSKKKYNIQENLIQCKTRQQRNMIICMVISLKCLFENCNVTVLSDVCCSIVAFSNSIS